MIKKQIAKIKGLIKDEVCMGTYGLVELELRELVKITEESKVDNVVLDDVIKCDAPTCKEPAHISHDNLCYHHKSTIQWE